MIDEIRLSGLGVIDEAVLAPHAGFTAVTGETGAGKTLVMTGLGFLLGGRAEAARTGTTVEGRLTVPPLGAVAARVREAGGDLDDDEVLLLARSVGGDGRSRAVAGGRSVPAAVLVELAQDLVAVHGQRDQHGLLRPSRQRAALDRFGGPRHRAAYDAYRAAWDTLRDVQAELDLLEQQARARDEEADALRDGLAEVAAVAPEPGEDDRLRAEAEVLGHADALARAATVAHAALVGDDATFDDGDAGSLLALAHKSLDGERAHDPALAALADRVGELSALVADLAGDLASYATAVEADPARLAVVQERRSALAALTRRYGGSVDEVISWAGRGTDRLAEIDGDDERREVLTARREEAAGALERTGAALTRARRTAADRFAAEVSAELAELAMPHARLQVALTPLPAAGPHGCEDVELLLAAHAGADPVPLATGASGGELSRVMLAVEVVFAGSDPVPTLVFDEVDAGVGGRAAVEVGRRLARLARSAQVLVVTHLPQVAAFADRQVVLTKTDDGRVSTTELRVVEGEDRVRELARMLAGMESSDTAAAHARELLALAADDADRATAPTGSPRRRRTG